MARPFHFTVDPLSPATFDQEDDGVAVTWAQSGTILEATGSTGADSRLIRKMDTENAASVEARAKASVSVNGPWGVVCNWQSITEFYMSYAGSAGTFRIFARDGGFSILASKSFTFTNDTFFIVKLETADNGADKDVEGFVNGVSELTATTSIKFGAGRCGIDANPTAGSTITFDWFAPKTVIQVKAITPSVGTRTGGQAVEIKGEDFGEGALVDIGGVAATSVVVTPNDTIHCVVPAAAADGDVDVTVKFGTP